MTILRRAGVLAVAITLVGGAAAQIPARAAATNPAIHFVIDVSGSMDGEKLTNAVAAVKDVAAGTPDSTALGLRSYSGDCDQSAVAPLVPIQTNDDAQIDAAADGLTAGGGTPTTEALGKGIDELAAYQTSGAKRLVLMTDGDTQCGISICDYVKSRDLHGLALTLYTVGIQVDSGAADDLRCAAQATGGSYIDVATPDQIAQALLQASGTAGPPALTRHADWVDDTQARSQGCGKVMLVAVRGSGEHNGPDKTLRPLGDQIDALIPRTTGFRKVYVDYTSAAVSKNLLTPGGQADYFNSITDGATRLGALLSDSARRCSGEKWIIAGYSQGALAIRLEAQYFAQASQFASFVAIGDPARNTSKNGYDVGTAGRHKGIYTLGVKSVPLPSQWEPRTVSLCNANDIVCDLGSPFYAAFDPVFSAPIGLRVHTTYPTHPDQYKQLAKRAVAQI